MSEQTPLFQLAHELIEKSGPITLGHFMSLCLGHPQYGYYMTREPFGAQGDFTTAPEISQLFGEMISVWIITTWEQMGKPENFQLIELGPGRGTLMKDIHRSLKIRPELQDSVRMHLVEFSPLLQSIQKKTLDGLNVTWHENIETVPRYPSIILANEFFDALPIEQAFHHQGHWYQRVVTTAEEDLILSLGAPLQGIFTKEVPDGAIYEYAPISAAYMDGLCRRIQEDRGALLVIDYGDGEALDERIGDTLQVLHKHQSIGLFDRVGESDVTAHVAFEALAVIARQHECSVSKIITQREFLTQLGIRLRTESLMASASEEQMLDLKNSVKRLVDPKEMGDLFKVMAVYSQ